MKGQFIGSSERRNIRLQRFDPISHIQPVNSLRFHQQAAMLFWAVLLGSLHLSAAAICDVCACSDSGFYAVPNDFVYCNDENWIVLTGNLPDLGTNTRMMELADIPLSYLTHGGDDFDGVFDGQLRSLTLRRTSLRFIPPGYFSHDIFSALEHLSLDGSLFDDLPELLMQVEQAPELAELVLDNNPLPLVTKDMWLIGNLHQRLAGLGLVNMMWEHPEDMLDHFANENLVALEMSENPIGDDMVFLKRLLDPVMGQLRLLALHDIGLKFIPEWFADMTDLITLELCHNPITTLDPYSHKCQHLDPSPVSLLPPNLERLWVDHNLLTEIQPNFLPSTLEYLRASHNQISELSGSAPWFVHLSQIKLLDFSYNELTAISPDWFPHPDDPASLEELWLQGNLLNTLPQEWLDAWDEDDSQSTSFFLSENPYSCECGAASIYSMFFKTNLPYTVVDIESIVCIDSDGTSKSMYDEIVNQGATEADFSSSHCTSENFCGVSPVNRFDCSDQALPTIPFFEGTPWYIDLSHNSIGALRPNTYLDTGDAYGVLELNLSHNNIGPTITRNDIENLIQIGVLNLSHNRISHVEPNTFTNNPDLWHLDLSHNRILTICRYGSDSIFELMLLPQTEIYLNENYLTTLDCDPFRMDDDQVITWTTLDLSHNCLDGRADYFSQANGGLRQILGTLDLSHNFYNDMDDMFSDLDDLICATNLNLENNLFSEISSAVIGAFGDPWDDCGSTLRLGDNPYICDCRALPFWNYYHTSFAVADSFIDFLSEMRCVQSYNVGQLIYEDYPACACLPGANPCFDDPPYSAECSEVVGSIPPVAECGPCPPGFSGDGITCDAMDPCIVEEPCYRHETDSSLFSVCTTLSPSSWQCGPCPSGMTGAGVGPQGCQDVNMCQIYNCYQDTDVTVECMDLPPPSILFECGDCPPGSEPYVNGVECNVMGQCCRDDNPCLDSRNWCFDSNSCINNVYPDTGFTCGPCPFGTVDLELPTRGRYCLEIDGCAESPCYSHEIPATCVDVPYTVLTGTNAFEVECTCALGMVGNGLGDYGCNDMNGCITDPCWSDDNLAGTGLMVEATCQDVGAYVGMVDPLEVVCTCPTGMEGDGHFCEDTDPCDGANNPCYDISTCSVISPPLDAVTCGHCPAGFTGDGRTCTDIDECSVAGPDACHSSLTCVPTPPPHSDEDYRCHGVCPCGMRKVNGGKGEHGCVEIDFCSDPNPCSLESSCTIDLQMVPPFSCGECAPGTIPVPDCGQSGTKACCFNGHDYPIRLSSAGVNPPLEAPTSGLVQIYHNGEWKAIASSSRENIFNQELACRALGFKHGRLVDLSEINIGALSAMRWINIECDADDNDLQECERSNFDGECVAPGADALVIACHHGVTGYHLLGGDQPTEGQLFASYLVPHSICETAVKPYCHLGDRTGQRLTGQNIDLIHICQNLGYPGPIEAEMFEQNPIEYISLQTGTDCIASAGDNPLAFFSSAPDNNPTFLSCDVRAMELQLTPENFIQLRLANNDWSYASESLLTDPVSILGDGALDNLCREYGFDHMESLALIDLSTISGVDMVTCTALHRDTTNFVVTSTGCSQPVLQLECALQHLEVRIVDSQQRLRHRGRVEVRSDGLWSTLVTPNTGLGMLANVYCRAAGYKYAKWSYGLLEAADYPTDVELRAEFGKSASLLRTVSGLNMNAAGCERGDLLDCELAQIASFEGRVRWMPTTDANLYTAAVECAEEYPVMELSHGHYGLVTVQNSAGMIGLCHPPAIDCSNSATWSPIATAICRKLGYVNGELLGLDDIAPIEPHPDVWMGWSSQHTCAPGMDIWDCIYELPGSCDPMNGNGLFTAVRCYDGYNACSDELNNCYDQNSCIDLPFSTDRLCSCPEGTEGNGLICTVIDPCGENNNPCYVKESCTDVSGTASCSPCPEGTEEANPDLPGQICLIRNGCLPNNCIVSDQCVSKPTTAAGYLCNGGVVADAEHGLCGSGYSPSDDLECRLGPKVAGSKECCVDMDGCADNPCGMDLQCYDLPAPSDGYTCGECPQGSQLDSFTGRCIDVNACANALNPCSENAFCEDLSLPSLTARCWCYAGYLQNTTGLKGQCPEVDICKAEPGICGVGRICLDWAPPADPNTVSSPAATCSACSPGYVNSPLFTFSLEQYEFTRQFGLRLGEACQEYDACLDLEERGIQTCYRFPGNPSLDVQCIDVPAEEHSLTRQSFRCGPCPTGMTGSGIGAQGCQEINDCDTDPCDDKALECLDTSAPLRGFTCVCPEGTRGVGVGNSQCLEIDSCSEDMNRCQFPDLCTDLPYDATSLFTCDCPKGMRLVGDLQCVEIDGCAGNPCYGPCEDIPWTDDLIVFGDGDGSEFRCDPCPRGMEGNAIGPLGCSELNLCSTTPDLCYDGEFGSASCIDIPHSGLMSSDREDEYRCFCPPGTTGHGRGPGGCANIDFCSLNVCGDNTVCRDFAPPSTGWSCDCAAGYARSSPNGPCEEFDGCSLNPCHPSMTCTDLPAPADPRSDYHLLATCSACPVGFVGEEKTVYWRNGAIENRASCTEIDGCLFNNTCWRNPLTDESLCEDVPGSSLGSHSTGVEIHCGDCPHGMTGNGDTRDGLGCVEIDGCSPSPCHISVQCTDVMWMDLSPLDPENLAVCGECPAGLRGDGVNCFGGCDFDTTLCLGDVGTGDISWRREVGLLDRRSDDLINTQSMPGEGPMFDHTQPLSTKGYYLTVDTYRLDENEEILFTLPTVHGPGAVKIIFYYYFRGEEDGTFSVRQLVDDGPVNTLWSVNTNQGDQWIGLPGVFAWHTNSFKIAFVYQRHMTQLSTVPHNPRLYVAVDDLFIDEVTDWQCLPHQLCYNGAECMQRLDGFGKGYDCFCKSGYHGELCDMETNACSAQPCHGLATCHAEPGGLFTCFCPPTHTGRLCELDLDECEILTADCGLGECMDRPGGYDCQCRDGFTGVHCEVQIDRCDAANCVNGDCWMGLNQNIRCLCHDGWTGARCDVNTRQCSTNPCLNGGRCTDATGPFVCRCPPGFTGRICEINPDDCLGVICQHGGICVDEVNGFHCDCPPGYEGTFCQRDTDECALGACSGHGNCYQGISNPACLCQEPGCRSQLDCLPRPAQYLCDCFSGYEGKDCEIERDMCDDNPCMHGSCVSSLASYQCVCDNGWQGTNCEWETRECVQGRCMNGAECVELIGDYACACQPGFTGRNCEININECDLQLCENRATCRDHVNGFECICTENFVGEYCNLFVVEVIEGDSGSSNSNPDDRSGGNPTDSISRHHHAETGALKAKVAPISTDSCQLWSHLTKEIQISVIAYTLVALLVTAILLFSYAVCRIKNGYPIKLMVRPGVSTIPLYGGQAQYNHLSPYYQPSQPTHHGPQTHHGQRNQESPLPRRWSAVSSTGSSPSRHHNRREQKEERRGNPDQAYLPRFYYHD